MMDRIAGLGRLGIAIIASFGRSGQFLFGVLAGVPRPATGFPLLVKQLYAVGVLSLAIVVVSGLFIGMVLGLQGYTILSDYGSESAIGQMIALTLVRELGPVVTALLFAGGGVLPENGVCWTHRLACEAFFVGSKIPHVAAAFGELQSSGRRC